jgi:hypothetical protein
MLKDLTTERFSMMQGNDIGNFNDIGQGVLFEGLLASPPERRFFQRADSEWDKELSKWKANDLPLKALVDSSDRLGVDTEVYTFLGQDAVDAIDRWLGRKGVSLPVYSYANVEELAYDLRFKRSVRTIYVPEQEQAAVIGLRATVADSKKAWSI